MFIAWLLVLCVLGWFLVAPPVHGRAAEERHESSQPVPATPAGGRKSPDLQSAVKRIISRTNEFRQAEGSQGLTPNPQLMETARDFANFMARTDKYGHTADGQSPAARAGQHGYDPCVIAENIGYQSTTGSFTTEELAQGFFQGWKDSPDHRLNMLDPAVTEIGVAVAQSERSDTFYAVQIFGRPKSQMIEFQITNQSNAPIEYEIGAQKLPLPPQTTRMHQSCQAAALTLRRSGTQEPSTVHPQNGDHYVIIRRDTGALTLEKK